MGWPTLAELKSELGVTVASTDDVLGRALQAAIDQVEIDTSWNPFTDDDPPVAVPVPASLSMAALVLAVMVAKAPAAPYGIAAVFDTGGLRVAAQHPTYLRLLVGMRARWPIA